MQKITAFTDCNSESIVIRMPYSLIVEILKNCHSLGCDELMEKVKVAAHRSNKLTQMLSDLVNEEEQK